MSPLPQFKCYLQGKVISIILSKWGFLHYCTLFFSFTVISTILSYIYFFCFHIHYLLSHLTLTSMKIGTRLFCLTDNYHGDVHLLFFVIVLLVVSNSLWPHELRQSRLPCPSPSPKACSNSCPLSQWCHPTISCSVGPFFSCPQSFPASGSFPMSQLHIRRPKYRASASVSVLLMNILGWLPLGLTDLVSLQSKGLSRVFYKTTVQKHQFFGAQSSLWSNSHIHTWLLEKP